MAGDAAGVVDAAAMSGVGAFLDDTMIDHVEGSLVLASNKLHYIREEKREAIREKENDRDRKLVKGKEGK